MQKMQKAVDVDCNANDRNVSILARPAGVFPLVGY